MSAKHKFKVPSANEIKESLPEKGNKFSLFKNYQNSKDKNAEHGSGNSSVSNIIPKSSLTVAETAKASKPLSKPSAALTSSKVSSSSTTTTTLSSTAEKTSSSVSTTSSSLSSSSSSSSLAATTAQATSGSLSGLTSSSKTASSSVSTSGQPPPSSSKPASSNSIIVNYRQRGNPILKHIRNVPWEFGSIVPDYVMGVANCALFLSLRYHQLHPEYLHNRLKELGKGYDLRVLLVQVDVKDPHHQLKDLAKICILADLTLILAFSPEEAGRYLEAYKVYENKPAEVLMEKTETDFSSKLTECLTTVKSVNKTDCMTLLSAFKSMEGIINASKEDISLCAGFGPQKAQRLYDVFHEPFLKVRKRANKTAGKGKDASPSKKPS